jgi:hypothetical protein
MLNLIQHPGVASAHFGAWPHWTLNQVQGDDPDLAHVALEHYGDTPRLPKDSDFGPVFTLEETNYCSVEGA